MSHELTAAQYSLKLAIPEVKQLLRDFLLNSQFNSQINLAFSLSLPQQSDSAKEIISQWLAEEGVLPGIEIVPSSSINGALGAYAAQTDTIYLSQEFLIQNQHNSDAVRNVLLEELGHAFSAQLNLEDAPGDEGNLFAHLVLGNNLSDHQLEDIKIEDDTATVILNQEITEIEQAKPGENTAFDLIGLTALRNDPNFADIDGTGFDVVVIDSGLDRTHPLLDDNYRFGLDYIDGDSNPNDLRGHGTHVSGTIGAENENKGNLIPGTENEKPNLNAPAIYSTIAVGAVWHSDRDPLGSYDTAQIPGEDHVAVFSQRLNINNFLFAPGVVIESTFPEADTQYSNGTSQASPHIAGSVALLQEIAAKYNVRLTPEQVRFYLIDNADIIQDGDDENDIVTNTNTAYPRINIHRSAIALREDLENAFAPSNSENITEDLNGTIRTAIQGPIISDFPSFDFPSFSFEPTILQENIGFDDGENLIGNTDVDLYRFTVASSSNISFQLNPFIES